MLYTCILLHLCYNLFMNNKTLKPIKISSAFALAIMFIFTAFCGYYDAMEYTYQLTFLSNFLTGVFLLAVGILWFRNKSVPQYFFLDFTMLLLIVFGVCIAFVGEFNFSDSFAFLHIVNPLLMLVFYLFLSNQTKTKWQFIITVLALPLAYLIFALIFGATTGDYIYFFLDYKEYGAGYTVLFIFGILVGLVGISVGLYFLNRLIHKHILKNV